MNTIFIIDWDDTLFPTTWYFNKNINKFELENKMKELDKELNKFLSIILKLGRVVIISNASYEWIIESSKFLYEVKKKIENKEIIIVSARQLYQHKTNINNWKVFTFRDYLKNNNHYNNIISIGDAEYEYNALVELYKNNRNKYYKTIKFMKYPNFNNLLIQINILNKIIKNIYCKKQNNDMIFISR